MLCVPLPRGCNGCGTVWIKTRLKPWTLLVDCKRCKGSGEDLKSTIPTYRAPIVPLTLAQDRMTDSIAHDPHLGETEGQADKEDGVVCGSRLGEEKLDGIPQCGDGYSQAQLDAMSPGQKNAATVTTTVKAADGSTDTVLAAAARGYTASSGDKPPEEAAAPAASSVSNEDVAQALQAAGVVVVKSADPIATHGTESQHFVPLDLLRKALHATEAEAAEVWSAVRSLVAKL